MSLRDGPRLPAVPARRRRGGPRSLPRRCLSGPSLDCHRASNRRPGEGLAVAARSLRSPRLCGERLCPYVVIPNRPPGARVRLASLGRMSNIYTAPALPPDFQRDQELEGTKPTVVHLDNLNEDTIQKWWDQFGKSREWKTLSQNCSTTVAQALDKGGGSNRAPYASHHMVWSPADAEAYARQIQAAGQGQYIPIALPKPLLY